MSNEPEVVAAGVGGEQAIWLKKAQAVCKRIPPLWPLQNFVAVNPYLGFSNLHFLQASAMLERASNQPALMPVAFYQKKLQAGRVLEQDLEEALALAKRQAPECFEDLEGAVTVTHLKLWLNLREEKSAPHEAVETVAEVADRLFRTTWAELVTKQISKHCAAYYDEGQSSWRMPWAAQSLFTAWRESALIDASLEVMGWKGVRQWVVGLPSGPEAALEYLLEKLKMKPKQADAYLHRLLLSIVGWSGHVQFKVRQNGLAGFPDSSLFQLLTIRLAYDVALMECWGSVRLSQGWQNQWSGEGKQWLNRDSVMHYVLHLAGEVAYQRQLVAGLSQAQPTRGQVKRPKVQAVFCIDVRSEVMRRALEGVAAETETRGFAGFFGMPIEYIPFGQQHGQAQCPVLLSPQFKVRETLARGDEKEKARALANHRSFRQFKYAWNAFKSSAISCFSFVETLGIGFAWKLFQRSFLNHLRAETVPVVVNRKPNVHECKGNHAHGHDHHAVASTGIALADQVRLAKGAIKHMGLSGDYARLVLLCAHGSETVNNPFAASLECGACGGHSGDANARVAAEILNQVEVRKALAADGVMIPSDTWFLAGLHNTTTDEVKLYDLESVPSSHVGDSEELRATLAEASQRVRRERALTLGIRPERMGVDGKVLERAADWSQVRPEWGLVNNAAFVVGPRSMTRGLNLGSRCFLHDYSRELDTDLQTLELILTAPVIVTTWINLQYYGSTVNHGLYGSGNKVLHNVVGTVGVCSGTEGDLRSGLPLQSVHDGKDWRHDPLRLSVFIAASTADIGRILEKHPEVQQLFDHGWIHLFAMDAQGKNFHRYLRDNVWMPVQA